MRLRKPCEHGRYDGHATKDGKYYSQVKMLEAHKYPAAFFAVCPGGAFLPEHALVIERTAEGAWPLWAASIVFDYLANNRSAQQTLDALALDPVAPCGSFGCLLPAGHNMGKADPPGEHPALVFPDRRAL